MLDVACTGIVVCCLAGAIYKEQGIIIYIQKGLWVMIASEGIHYFNFWMVTTVAEYYERVSIQNGAKAEANADPKAAKVTAAVRSFIAPADPKKGEILSSSPAETKAHNTMSEPKRAAAEPQKADKRAA